MMVDLYNKSALSLMISIGHRVGLFDALDRAGPSTSQRLAEHADLDERYVREWLGAMTTGRIVAHDPTTNTFWLPKDHADLLTRRSAEGNLAVTAQFIPVLAGVEDEIVACFRDGGGVPYASFPRFHDVMAEESDQTVVAALAEHILPLAPGLTYRLQQGIDVLDAGCGRGHAMLELAARYPSSRFLGVDLSEAAVRYANDEAQRRGRPNVTFEVLDLTAFETDRRFDLITSFDAIHDQADPAGMLRGIATSLRKDGVYLAQDIAGASRIGDNMDAPLAPFIYTISCLHCMTVSLAQGGAGLGAAWGEQLALRMLHEAGFERVAAHRLEHDIMNVYYVAQRT
ncbi:MAG: class I SAM-dependent methyltransferase [Planctomycetota bacterium]